MRKSSGMGWVRGGEVAVGGRPEVGGSPGGRGGP